MAYLQTTCKAGDTIEIERLFSGRYGKGKRRCSPANPTSEEQKKINDRAARKKFRRKINANFSEGDHHLVLGWPKINAPADEAEMVRMVKNFIDRLKRRYKKTGTVLKWVYVTEIGSKGARHVHMIVNRCPGIDAHTYQKIWGKGNVGDHPLNDEGNYSQLSDYLLKQTSKALHEGMISQRYHCSRNLVTPPEKREVIQRNVFAKPPRRKGYILAESYEGVTKWGYDMQFFMFVKLRP